MFHLSSRVEGGFKTLTVYNKQIVCFKTIDNQTIIDFINPKNLEIENSIKLGSKTMHIYFRDNNNLYAYWPLERLIRINEKCEIENLDLNWGISPDILTNNTFFGTSVDSKGNRFLSKYDLTNKKVDVISKTPFRFWKTNEQMLFGVKVGVGNELYAIDILSNDILWQRQFDSKLNGRLFFYENQIIISSSNYLYCLNKQTGKVLWTKEQNDRLVEKEDRLINVDAGYFREISLLTGKTEKEYQMDEEYKRVDFYRMGTNSRYAISESHIFIAEPFGNKVGSINRVTGKIDWVEELYDKQSSVIESPVIFNTNVFYLDSKGCLLKYSPQQ
ncbi:PQQ-binding-like beta-propeller repeat protein [Carboxylicivirga marina]|uniref:outer membrane protein assembly factor BamB family protein n=1 Tax=Carboxylicivirga marina TaxID=2800988 RepID=UPI0025955DE7|nr:PQQ-binding-like beta-propeller repeat protein [uncultured Carboxylicivirga sp.]